MPNTAYLPIVADRYGALVRHVFLVGLDLTDLAMRAQIRLSGDTPGRPLVDLLTVTNGNAEGLRLIEVTFDALGLPTSHVEIVVNESTMEALPYMGEIGDATPLAWDWQVTIAGRKRRLAKGEFEVTGDGVTGADAAPRSRMAGYGRPRQPISNVWSSARLTFGEEQVTVQIDGADLVAPLAKKAGDAANAAAASRTAAELAAATAQASSRYFATKAAGETGSTAGQMFSTDDGAGSLIYYRRTAGGSTEIGRALTPARLAAANGAALIGFQSGSHGVLRNLLDKASEVRSVNDFADGEPEDWTEAINAAILASAKAGGGEVTFGEREDRYTVLGPVIVPSFVRVNLKGQLLSGAGSTIGNMFITGYLAGDTLLGNLDSPPEQDTVYGAAVFGGRIEDVDQAIHFRNFTRGGRIEDLAFENVRRPMRMERCFYALVDNISMAGGSDPAYPSIELYDQNNAMVVRRVSAITEWGMLVHGGASALTIDTPSFEGGGKGLVLRDDIIGASIRNGYFEAISGPAIDSTAPGTRWIHYEANYFNIVDQGFADGGPTGEATHFGEWGASNRLNQANVDATLPQLPGYTFRGEMQFSGKRQYMTVDPGASQTDLSHVVAPDNWVFGAESAVRSLKLYSGDGTTVNARAVMWSGVVPLVLRGDCGALHQGPGHFVPACDVDLPTGTNVTATITTRLTFRPDTLFAKYQLTINDNRGGRRVYGDVFGADVDPRDRSDLTVTAVGVNIGGTTYTQLRVAGINNMNGAVTVRGIVRMVG